MEKKILLVENELSIRQFLKINFDREGFHVLEADRGDKAIEIALLEKPQVVLLDIGLEGYGRVSSLFKFEKAFS